VGDRQDEARAHLLPFVPGEVTNGEFIPRPASAHDRLIVAESLRRAEQSAARLGLDRRRFLRTTGGMALMLGVVNACSSSGDSSAPSTTPSSAATTRGGTFEVPEPEDIAACDEALGGTEFIVDVHTHHVMPDGPWRQNSPRIESMIVDLVPDGCTEADPLVFLDRQAYVRDLLVGSDTSVGMLSDVPNSGPDDAPVPFDAKVGTQDFAESMAEGGEPRVLVQSVLAPNFYDLDVTRDLMAAQVETGRVASFKFYTAWGPGNQGYALDSPDLGLPIIEHARDLGIATICAHKGLPLLEFDRAFNGPDDLASLAVQYPDMNFVVFHSAFERETTETPYAGTGADLGIDSLVRAMDAHGLAPNSNLWCELGTTWREVLSSPTEAAHTLGKVLSRVGEDRVMWGTDAIWFGSPQPQIMAFRAFQITPEFQEQYGYPALTDELKAKVFGLNAANLFGLDPAAQRCAIDPAALDAAKAELTSFATAGGPQDPWRPRGPVTRRELVTWLRDSSTRWQPW
jgi:predicted TIM-barrel fold metal-dependent hydrolase